MSSRIKKILVLVRCPLCGCPFYIDEKELKAIPKQICRACHKVVELEVV